MKRIISSFLCLIFVFILGASAFVKEEGNNLEITRSNFSDIIVPYYENQENVKVINKDGSDITDVFYMDTWKYYKQQDYDYIEQYCKQNVKIMSRIEVETQTIETRASSTKSISEVFTEYPEDDILGHRITVNYTISGTYIYDRNTGKILSAYNASLKNIMYADAGVGWHFSPKNISTNANKSSDGYTARFSASFHLYGNFSGENVKIEDADFGTLGDTVEVTPGSD